MLRKIEKVAKELGLHTKLICYKLTQIKPNLGQ